MFRSIESPKFGFIKEVVRRPVRTLGITIFTASLAHAIALSADIDSLALKATTTTEASGDTKALYYSTKAELLRQNSDVINYQTAGAVIGGVIVILDTVGHPREKTIPA